MKKIWLVGMLGLVSLSLIACGTSKKEEKSATDSSKETLAAKQTAIFTVPQEINTLDLSLATDKVSFGTINQVFEGLYRQNADNQVEPAGAEELAEKSADGLTYTFKLRKDAKWSNGDPVVAADYVYSWQRTVDPATGSQYAYLFESIKNASDIVAGKKEPSELGVEAVSDTELKVTLANATPYFESLMAFPSFFPLQQKTVEKYGKEYATTSDKMVYNGPFTLADFDGAGTDDQWTYKKNKDYWDAKNVKMTSIENLVIKESSTGLNLFQDNKVDDATLTGELAQQLANDDSYTTDKDGRTVYIELNQRKSDSPFKNVNLRKAIAYAIDSDAIVNNILGNGSIAATGLIPSELASNTETKEDFAKAAGKQKKFSKKEAQAYWKKAKKELGISSLKFDLLTDDDDASKKVAEYIQGALKENISDEIDVTITSVTKPIRLDRSTNGEFDLVLGGWGADYADPSTFLDLFNSTNTYNRGRYTNSEYDKLIKKASTTDVNDPEKRWDDMLDAEKVIMDDMGVIPIYQVSEGHLRNTKIKDYVTHTSGAPYDYKWMYLVK